VALAAGLLAAGVALRPSEAATGGAPEQVPPAQAAARRPAGGAAPEKADHLGDPLPPGALMRLGTLRHQLAWRSRLLADGKALVPARGDRLCWVDVDEGTVRRSWPLPPRHTFLGASDDGRQVALTDQTTVSLWDAGMGQRLRALAEQPGDPAPAPPTARLRAV